MAMTLQKIRIPTRKRVFYLAASHRQIEKWLLCVLSVFAMRILSWTRVNFSTPHRHSPLPAKWTHLDQEGQQSFDTDEPGVVRMFFKNPPLVNHLNSQGWTGNPSLAVLEGTR
jgi:hypothetical protein